MFFLFQLALLEIISYICSRFSNLHKKLPIMRRILFFILILASLLAFILFVNYYGGLSGLASSKLFHPYQVDSLKQIANRNGIASFWIESLNDSVILKQKIRDKQRLEKEIEQIREELEMLESNVHLINMGVSWASKNEPNYSSDALENHFIQNGIYLDKHKDIKRELDMKHEHIKRLKENIYSRQRFIDNLSSKK